MRPSKKDFPYLYMSKEELRAIPNEELKKLVYDHWHMEAPKKCEEAYWHQLNRLTEEKLRRQFAGIMEPLAGWNN